MNQKGAFFKEHKNKILFLLLVLAIVTTYFFEERANILEKENLDRQSSLIFSDNLGPLKGVTGIKINLEKRGAAYHDRENNLKLSTARLDEFFQILSWA